MTIRALLASLLVVSAGCMNLATQDSGGGGGISLPPDGSDTSASACGDGFCEAQLGETPESCPLDCSVTTSAPACGDGVCEAGESCASCPSDCGTCTSVPVCDDTTLPQQLPVQLTDTTVGASAQADTAACGDGETSPTQTYSFTPETAGVYVLAVTATFPAVLDVRHTACGGADLACDASEQTNATQLTLPLQAGETVQVFVAGEGGASGTYQLALARNADACGDAVCEASETSDTCPVDCPAPPTSSPAPAPVCGDGVCDPGEDSVSCSEDCGAGTPTPTPTPTCGDGTCDAGEDSDSCPSDCGSPSPPPSDCDPTNPDCF